MGPWDPVGSALPPLSRYISTVNKTIVQQAGTFLKYTLKIEGGTETEKAKNMVFQPPLLGLPVYVVFLGRTDAIV